MNQNDKITIAQAIALNKVFNRTSMTLIEGMPQNAGDSIPNKTSKTPPANLLSFEEWVMLGYVMADVLMIPWCGMWLGIEPDGYTHS